MRKAIVARGNLHLTWHLFFSKEIKQHICQYDLDVVGSSAILAQNVALKKR